MKTQITIPCAGYSIAADLYYNESIKDFLFVIVGFGSSKARNENFVDAITSGSGLNALVIDLTGHGESPFQLDDVHPAQHMTELVSAFDWLTINYPDVRINVMGTSYGGFLASYLTQYRSFSKLVLRTPALYRPEDFYTPHKGIDKVATAKEYRSSLEIVANPIFTGQRVSTGPTLVVIHSLDETVPVETTDRYVASFTAEVYLAEGFRHAYSDQANPDVAMPQYVQTICNWLLSSK